jgi:hypothetical protein
MYLEKESKHNQNLFFFQPQTSLQNVSRNSLNRLDQQRFQSHVHKIGMVFALFQKVDKVGKLCGRLVEHLNCFVVLIVVGGIQRKMRSQLQKHISNLRRKKKKKMLVKSFSHVCNLRLTFCCGDQFRLMRSSKSCSSVLFRPCSCLMLEKISPIMFLGSKGSGDTCAFHSKGSKMICVTPFHVRISTTQTTMQKEMFSKTSQFLNICDFRFQKLQTQLVPL